MKHVLDALRDALPGVATPRGEGQVHIPAGVGIKAPARQAADDRAARGLSKRGVTRRGLFDESECSMV
jgi:hypothetical protein